jgi:hypothetical protein
MRQRNPDERRVLAALHDGVPARYIEWAESTERIDVVDGGRLVERAVGEWIPAAVEFGAGRAVMIARDNKTRSELNDAARMYRQEAGDLGEELWYGQMQVAVGDRVICRGNDARVGVDNGTRGTVRDLSDRGVVLRDRQRHSP